MNKNFGKVYLLGAGPGKIEYLTIEAKQILARAEVLIYDALVSQKLLTLVPDNCLQLNVGKRGGSVSTSQTQINQLLIAYCQEGKRVIRLKSGDAFVFGRAVEEIEALNHARCAWQIIPGISSALAAATLANIPLTEKNWSNCFAILSAHEPKNLDWEVLARIDTLVILMGGSTLKEIVRQLQAKGREPTFPIAIIRNCGSIDQQIWRGNLATIVQQTEGISLSPVVIIIGKVVELSEGLEQVKLSSLPLNKVTILVTRAAEQSSQFTDLLQEQGARVIEMPALEIIPPSSWQKLDEAIINLTNFSWLILTSANAVDYFFQRLFALGKDIRILGKIKIAVVGKKTNTTLKKYNLQADFIPPNFVADSLVENFPEPINGQKILFPRVETGGREILVQEFSQAGAIVEEVPAYQSVCPEKMTEEIWEAIKNKQINIITFASSKTVQNFYRLLSEKSPETDILTGTSLASIGPQTSNTCRELFGRVDIEAAEYTLEGLTAAIISYQETAMDFT